MKGPQGISKGTFKHDEFADVDHFLCLQFKAIKIKYFHFFNNFLLANHKNKEAYVYKSTVTILLMF